MRNHDFGGSIRLSRRSLITLAGCALAGMLAPTCLAAPAEEGSRYQLAQVLVLSRHNIRSPLSGAGSVLESVTPHEWFCWTSAPGELSVRGGQLETAMGQYFREYLEHEGLIPHNWRPTPNEVRFYANSLQRTMATARFFSAGLLPSANVTIEQNAEFGTMDPVFNPAITFMSDEHAEEALAGIAALGGPDGLAGIDAGLAQAYALVEEVLDFAESPMAQQGDREHLTPGDLGVTLIEGEEPQISGSLKLANSIADALTLQFYEDPDALAAAFGHQIVLEDWEAIASIRDVYQSTLFSTPSIAINVAHPLLVEMRGELAREGRAFTFLCGHDSNIASVLATLNAMPYELPGAIVKKAPIGVKLVVQVWQGPGDTRWATLHLVYQSLEQLRACSTLSLENPPMWYQLELAGLSANEDGMYLLDDVLGRFDDAIYDYEWLGRMPVWLRHAA